MVTLVPGKSRTPDAVPRAVRRAGDRVSRGPRRSPPPPRPAHVRRTQLRPVRRAVATTSGCAKRICSTRRPISSDFGSDVPGSGVRLDRQRALVEFRKEDASPIRVIATRAATSSNPRPHDEPRVIQRRGKILREASLKRTRHPAVVPAQDRSRRAERRTPMPGYNDRDGRDASRATI